MTHIADQSAGNMSSMRSDWEWVERAVWTDRMLKALQCGVKGLRRILRKRIKRKRGMGHCLNDHLKWRNAFSAGLGTFRWKPPMPVRFSLFGDNH